MALDTINVAAQGVDRSTRMKIPLNAALNTSGSAGNAATLTLTASAASGIVLGQIIVGCTATPASTTTVKVEDGSGSTKWGPMPVVGTGPFVFDLDPLLQGTRNTAMIITVSAPGGAVVASIQAAAWLEQ